MESKRISLPGGHCGFGDLRDDVRNVGKRANNGSRIEPPGCGAFRFRDVVNDAFHELGCVDVIDVRGCHEPYSSMMQDARLVWPLPIDPRVDANRGPCTLSVRLSPEAYALPWARNGAYRARRGPVASKRWNVVESGAMMSFSGPLRRDLGIV